MDIEKLIGRLYTKQLSYASYTNSELAHVLEDASTALSTLQDENGEMQKQLNMFSEFLCYMTGGLLSKTNYTAQEMVTAAEDYQQKVCGECDLRAENEKLRAELEQVKRERDAAVEAVKNMAEYIVCAGRVDYYLCDEISQEHHLKYQPKNDGNYDNEPCYKCIADWFLQGHVWRGN